jgi:signal transduction histidine kinase
MGIPGPPRAAPTAGVAAPARPRGTALPRRDAAWLAAGTALCLLGAAALVRWDIAVRREAFATDARIAHRLLSQRAAQLDAVLATLALLTPADGDHDAAARLPALWPSVLAVHRSDGQHPWPDAALADAEVRSRALPAASRHPVLAAVDARRLQYTLVLAGAPASWALQVDARGLVPAADWPLSDDGPVRAVLASGRDELVLHPGAPQDRRPAGLTPGFTFAKPLATPSHAFELRLQRATGPAEWPWGRLLAWALACAATTALLAALHRARDAQRRSAGLIRMAQAARLNTLAELTAGMAHELNQPLAAVLASAQAAQRLLASPEAGDDGPDLPAARQALALAAAQARRASDVLARLRRLVQDPTHAALPLRLDLHALCTQMLHLLGPELQRRGIAASVSGSVPAAWADPVMVEQIVHNLVTNAMQALVAGAGATPTLTLVLEPLAGQAGLRVRDNGPGFAPEVLARAFEPFFSTRDGGLGLGLPLCETLARAMGGGLQARNLGGAAGAGAELLLTLPLAGDGAARWGADAPGAVSR